MTRKEFLRAGTALAVAALSRRALLGASGQPSEQLRLRTDLPNVIRVGLVGLAGHYSDVTGATSVIPNIRITAVSDPNSAVLERTGRTAALASAQRWTDYREMLATEKLDVVAECGENAARTRIIEECAKRRLPILTEKPLALTLSELATLKRTLVRSGTPLSMLLTMRGGPPYLAMREIVASGRIGEVVSMDAQKSYQLGTRPEWMKTRKSFGGTIPYIGIHMLDLMRWISGREFVEGSAFHSNVGSPEIGEMENNAAIILKLDNHGSASMRIDYLRPRTAKTHGDDRLRMVGTRGIIEYKEEQLTLVTDSEPLSRISSMPEPRSLFVDFVESLYLGKKPIISRDEIFRISEIVLKLRSAADSERIVRL